MFQVMRSLFKIVNLLHGSVNIQLTPHQIKSIFAERYAHLLCKALYSTDAATDVTRREGRVAQ